MLQSIYIQNYALIDKLEMNFYPGFSVITGETGAGKSIILGAIGLLLGQRADAKAIKNGASKSIVEAHFRITGHGMKTSVYYGARCRPTEKAVLSSTIRRLRSAR